MSRYSLRIAANDDCWITVSGFRTWRWYYQALYACWKANRSRSRDDVLLEPIVVWDDTRDEAVAWL